MKLASGMWNCFQTLKRSVELIQQLRILTDPSSEMAADARETKINRWKLKRGELSF